MSIDFVRGKWRARISVNRERFELGRFESREDAQRIYDAALERHAPSRRRKPREKKDPSVRFSEKCSRQPDGCIVWLGATDKDGYGKFQLNGDGRQTHVRAHRYAFFLRHGRWPLRLALHKCDNTSCVNPEHLEEGDQGKNVRDCVARGRHRPGRRGRVKK